MNISLSLETLARPILSAMNSYNWERWLEYDGAEHAIPNHYEQQICEYLNYLSAVGIHYQVDRDSDNGMFGGLTINGESLSLDFYVERQRYLDRYHPGEKVPTNEAPSSSCSNDIPLLFAIDDMFDSDEEEESE